MFHNKPIIGISGGIGSGKSFVARLFGEMGCKVFHADDQVRAAYEDPAVRLKLREWWGGALFKADGAIDKPAIARRIFSEPAERERLEGLLHPWVIADRDRTMTAVAGDPNLKAFVWDTPLLFETGIEKECDALVFVEAPVQLRYQRLASSRGWDLGEITRRENLQWPLDKKRKMSHYVLVNTADAGECRSQVREILSRILAN